MAWRDSRSSGTVAKKFPIPSKTFGRNSEVAVPDAISKRVVDDLERQANTFDEASERLDLGFSAIAYERSHASQTACRGGRLQTVDRPHTRLGGGPVAALDDVSLPLADLTWVSPSRAIIQTSMHPGQVVSVQETFMPGWQASVAGRNVPVRADKLGLIVVDPGCDGPCKIDLWFGVTTEAWICRVLSTLVTLIALGLVVNARRFRTNIGSASMYPTNANL